MAVTQWSLGNEIGVSPLGCNGSAALVQKFGWFRQVGNIRL